MAKITIIEHGGAEHIVHVENGWSVMEAAVRNNIAGIEAECGGCCACATCHVYIDDAWTDKLPEIDESENDMLDCTTSDRESGSRLACQIKVSNELDGLVVRLPESQI